LRKLLAIPPPNIVMPTIVPPPTTPSIKKYVQIKVGKLQPSTLQQIQKQREHIRQQKFGTVYQPHQPPDVDSVDLQQNSSTTVHRPKPMYKVILPTWYHANATMGWQPHLPTGQWFPHHGAATATPTSTSSPEATASPLATATTAAAPNTATAASAPEPSEMTTPTAEAAPTADMETDSVPAADGTPAATPLA
jgi:hypothetical protein